ncbi:DNA-processing protein DprA [Marilutibacter aestuarii]|uniref:DNA-protecting protein DprA n=1 Tax=Marilutibacter aestuarii TaxID=1706195 RepID=A0A508AFN0_9GAMM|nr:DNA-processing protein DprA [Lysobacter aestuarii]TQD47723.1 DNA-protecting protein DprA [Lysobacter aestuarii]
MITDDHLALLRLLACGGASAPRRRLLGQARTPAAALEAGASTWRACGLEPAQVAVLRAAAMPPGRVLDWLSIPGHHLLGWHEPDYPALLRHVNNPPLALFVVGDPLALWQPAVAVVGSRRPSPGGLDNARGFARALVRSGLTVTSGMAAGIDTAAHRASLAEGGHTIAVLGTGPDVAYPPANDGLHADLLEQGIVVSEFPPGTGPRPEHFPRRNRIIAGLALGTLVIEAAARSGALITARLAAEAGREVFAVPGSVHNPMARGCHRLIGEGATLVQDIDDLTGALAPLALRLADDLRRRLGAPTSGDHTLGAGLPASPGGGAPGPGLKEPCDSPDHNTLWESLGHDPTDMDQLVERSGLTAAQVSSMLLVMELEGRVTSQHGRYFRRH